MTTEIKMYDLGDGHELVGEEKAKAIDDGIATRVVIEGIDKAMENGIHCAGCTFVTLQLKPSDMYCPWCMGEAKARVAELEAMVRELVEATEAEYHVVAGDQYHMLCPGSAIKVNTTCSWIVMATGERSSHRNKDRVQILNAARAEALALLNSGNAGNSADR